MIIVPIGASKVPCWADTIITEGARAKINQAGPPMIQSKCQTAAKPAIIPPVSKN